MHGVRAPLRTRRLTVLTPTPRTDPGAVRHVAAFWEALGSRVRLLPADEHDRILGLTSHLPHLTASALAGVLPPEWADFAATGFRDTTRLAASDPDLWAVGYPVERWNVTTCGIEPLPRYQPWRLRWYRYRWLQLNHRKIMGGGGFGFKPGTGGSGGVSYLAKALELKFFPELWKPSANPAVRRGCAAVRLHVVA